MNKVCQIVSTNPEGLSPVFVSNSYGDGCKGSGGVVSIKEELSVILSTEIIGLRLSEDETELLISSIFGSARFGIKF